MTQPPGSTPGQPTNRPPSGPGGPYGQPPQSDQYGQPSYGQQQPSYWSPPYGQSPQQPYGSTPYGQSPQQPSPYGGPPYGASTGHGSRAYTGGSSRSYGLAKAASLLSLVGALLALMAGLWEIVFRRGTLADVDDGGEVSTSDLDTSDLITNLTFWAAVVVAVTALVLWIASIISARRGAGALGVAGLALSVVGLGAALVGWFAALTALDDRDPGDAATGYVISGIGMLMLSLGLLLGALALRKAAPGASPAGPPSDRGAPGGYGPPSAQEPPYGRQPYPQQPVPPPGSYAQPPQQQGPYGQQQPPPDPYGQPPRP